MDYSIENMIDKFQEHSEKALAQRNLNLELFPDSEYLKDDFCISTALLSICQEINFIKKQLEIIK